MTSDFSGYSLSGTRAARQGKPILAATTERQGGHVETFSVVLIPVLGPFGFFVGE
jgi:hypothetical protein